jgi:nucleoside-diphosphate-sugar epimerase
MEKTAFVTGGSGFVGRNLIAALRSRGYSVRALARSDGAAAEVARAGGEAIRGELDDEEAVQRGMAGAGVVFHVAADTRPWGSYAEAYRTNVLGSEHVLAAARAGGVPRLVHVSSEAVLVGRGERAIVNVDESRPRAKHPTGIYNRTKALAEERVQSANSAELQTVIIRPRLIWGAGDTSLWLPALTNAVQSRSFRWIGGGHHLTSTTHVANVVEGLILAAERGRGGEIYFITDGQPIEFRRFVTDLLGTQSLEPGDRSVPLWLALTLASTSEWVWRIFNRKGSPPLTRAIVRTLGEEITVNDTKARRELGYVGKTSRDAGLAAMAGNRKEVPMRPRAQSKHGQATNAQTYR